MIKIVCVGKIKEKYLRDAISDYEKRISKYHKINIIEVDDSNMKEESTRILKNIKKDDFVITLEINGNVISSMEFANKIDKDSEFGPDAERLIKLLKYFVDVDEKWIPCNSLLKEFIGGSCYRDSAPIIK